MVCGGGDYNQIMFVFDPPSLSVLAVILLVSELLIGWIPWFIAHYRSARGQKWIAISGIIVAPAPILFLGVLFWALLAPPVEPDGPGFPVESKKTPREE